MKFRSFLLASVLFATPAFAETVIVHEGGPESADVGTRFAGAYNVQHADFYVNSSADATIANLEANIAATTSQSPAIVTMYANDLENYASAALWVSAYKTHIANVRAALPNVKIVVITPLPKTGSTSALRTAIGLLRAAERVEIDYIIDFAANPSMNDKTAPYTQFADANKYSSNIPTACTTACTLSAYTDTCSNLVTTGGTKGNDYLTKQYFCGVESVLANKYPWTVYETTVAYDASYAQVTTDPPANTLAQEDDVATSVSQTGWRITDGSVVATTFVAHTGMEKKFRTSINGLATGGAIRADALRAPGQTVSGHCHVPFGNSGFAGTNTYKSLRSSQGPGVSTSAGGPLNETSYWVPCSTKPDVLGSGITKVKKIDLVSVYYVSWNEDIDMWTTPRGFSGVFGTYMDDPQNLKWKAELNANVTWIGKGFSGWKCDSTAESHGSLANFDGTDRFTTPCPTSSPIRAVLSSAGCWDGINTRSSDGYAHTRRQVSYIGPLGCARNWYGIPEIQYQVIYSHTGDYYLWDLDSDAAATATATALAGTSVVFRRGESFHGDWQPAWDWPTFLDFHRNCIGAKETFADAYTPHQCDYSTINTSQRLLSDATAPDGGRNPQVNISNSFNGDVAGEWWDLPALTASPSNVGHRRRARLHKRN
jgi:hypothetical protein